MGYYADFGSLNHLAGVLREGWFYQGQYSEFRHRQHGNSPRGIPRSHFVVGNQDHDQVGNRARGERLSALVNFEAQKLAAGMTLLSPFVPLLFMGEEFGELSPFQYFTSHGDKDLVEAVRSGRRKEFLQFGWNDDVPDPQEETTFSNSKLRHNLRDADPHRTLRLFYQELIRFRRANHLAADADLKITESDSLRVLTILRIARGISLLMIFNFNTGEVSVPFEVPPGSWTAELNSADSQWLGPGNRIPRTVDSANTFTLSGQSFFVFRREIKN
jgi:maltooligosyltrehalose trehalohydrolase